MNDRNWRDVARKLAIVVATVGGCIWAGLLIRNGYEALETLNIYDQTTQILLWLLVPVVGLIAGGYWREEIRSRLDLSGIGRLEKLAMGVIGSFAIVVCGGSIAWIGSILLLARGSFPNSLDFQFPIIQSTAAFLIGVAWQSGTILRQYREWVEDSNEIDTGSDEQESENGDEDVKPNVERRYSNFHRSK